jgi:DNA-binding LacI/PurR family transcriptional regulator
VVTKVAHGAGTGLDVLHLDQLELPFWIPADQCIEAWRDGLREALRGRVAATAVLCWNDRMALGLYAVLAEMGLAVPGDVSVLGFDDDEAALALPPLDTISQEYRRIGSAATQVALRLAEEQLSVADALEIIEWVPSRFVRRHSIGPAR